MSETIEQKVERLESSCAYYLAERNRAKSALLEIADAARRGGITSERAVAIAEKALRLEPWGKARWKSS